MFRADLAYQNSQLQKRKHRRWYMAGLLLLCVGLYGLWSARMVFWTTLPELPEKAQMWQMGLSLTYTLYDRSGTEIGHRGPYIDRPLSLRDMPAYVPQAFIAIEDARFYKHKGVDIWAVMRAFIENVRAHNNLQGGSTLTQQLVKNMLLSPEKTYRRKLQEMRLAYKLERVLSKDEILSLYLNRISLGERIVGVEAASQRYFGVSVREVSLAQAALLAALPKAPSRYDLYKNFNLAWTRAQKVLDHMVAQGFITLQEARAAAQTPQSLVQGVALSEQLTGYVFDMATQDIEARVGHKHQDLRIYTTLDINMQKTALMQLEQMIVKHGSSRRVEQGAVVVLDNADGAIRALVGGVNYMDSQFNRAIQAVRQPGSAFKALVFARALEAGIDPGSVRIDRPVKFDGWSPKNYSGRYRGLVDIRTAFIHSVNTVAAQLTAEVGPETVVELARRFGIKADLTPSFALALGASEVNLLDLSAAYMVFANAGQKLTPYLIERIENTAGQTLYQRTNVAAQFVYDEALTRKMVSLLQDVITKGTASAAKLDARPVAGKTGTSQEYRDAWFIGFTDQYSCGVWLGNDDNRPMNEVTGGQLPAELWQGIMQQIHNGLPVVALSSEPDIPLNRRLRKRAQFYKTLADAFVAEREIASRQAPDQAGIQP